MNDNRIHRRYVTGILVALWWWALASGRFGEPQEHIRNEGLATIFGIAMMWGVPVVIYGVCLRLFPDDKPTR